MQRKCCVHCPGEVTRTGEPAREHSCPEAPAQLRAQGSCYDRFATAKKFHAENLQHQPLPDKVDDAVFAAGTKEPGPGPACDLVRRCQRIVPRRQAGRKKELGRAHRYAPALGCKAPATYMDLAICWETPLDPSYEPRRPGHIDGSDGGPAPAIFALVRHEASQVDVRDGCIPGRREGPAAEQPGAAPAATAAPDAREQLCRELNSISLAGERKGRPAVGAAARKRRADFLRHCAGNVGHEEPPRPRPARSASCLQKRGCAVVERKSDGLAGRLQVPRPRTPYARRAFCIDTLAPPFSLVSGCRDADYPEHWRLTSIYQQSYRNPRKMREGRTLLNYDRAFL